jgi:hypothetical protein
MEEEDRSSYTLQLEAGLENPAQWAFLGFFGFVGFFYIFAQKREFLGFFQFQE